MTNAELIAKIEAEIQRLKGQLIRGACAAQIEMETNCKEEAYDEVLSFLSTLESEKPVPNDLEEAAEISFDEAYALTEDYRDFLAKGLTEKRPRPIGPHWFCEYAKNRFIAGAKWQEEQDQETIELAEDHAYLAGSVNEREKMMKEAVECYYGYVNNCTKVFLPEETLKGIKEGYVKIVILKNDGYPSDKKD